MEYGITVNLDRERMLRLTMKAMVEFERTNKIKLMDIGDNMSVETCAKLAYSMLKQDDPELTLDKTIDLFDNHLSPGEAIEKINEAILQAFPKNAAGPGRK